MIDLLQCVRLGLLTTNFFLEKVKCHPYIITNEACKPLLIDTLKYLYELDVDTYQVCLYSYLNLFYCMLKRIHWYKIPLLDHVFHMKYFLYVVDGQVEVQHQRLNCMMCVFSRRTK
jgi:hypothetical protein